MEAAPNNPADDSTENDSMGFSVVTCEIPLTRMGRNILNNLRGKVHSNIHINVVRA